MHRLASFSSKLNRLHAAKCLPKPTAFAPTVFSHCQNFTTDKPLQIINPATEEIITQSSNFASLAQRIRVQDTKQSITEKITRAKAAQKFWVTVPLAERIEIMERFAQALDLNADKLASVLSTETGKPVKQAKGEIKATVGRVRFFMNNVAEAIADIPANSSHGVEETISWEPIGVVANVSAWNYPYFVSTNVIIPALLTGNAVLFKPSEHSTLSGLLLVDLLQNAGIPLEVITPIIGEGSVGADLVSSEGINGIFFTGSHPTGVKIAQASAHNLVKLQEELGGKDGFYVREDADIDYAVGSLADGAFYNTGQSCCSVERIYVHKNIYNKFVEKFIGEVKEFKIGDPSDAETYIGPLTRKSQLEVLEKQVQDAVSKEATLHLGGKRTNFNGKGYYFEPTVLSNVNHSMLVMKEESFGPIIGIQSVENDDEALSLLNDCDYGLTAGVYSKDAEKAKNILKRVNAGTVYLNCCDRVSPYTPWSGRKNSGIGMTLSKEGFKSFVQPKSWQWKESM